MRKSHFTEEQIAYALRQSERPFLERERIEIEDIVPKA